MKKTKVKETKGKFSQTNALRLNKSKESNHLLFISKDKKIKYADQRLLYLRKYAEFLFY